MLRKKIGAIPYGGDYNPEQWDEATWHEDIRIMKYYGVNTATINVFGWALVEPEEGRYDFAFLDNIVEMLAANGISMVMGTGTSAVPRWMGEKYPEVLYTDKQGRHHTPGNRENYCPNSPVYREKIRAVCNALAEHYKDRTDILLWHMANEVGLVCYCKHCAQAFREHLKRKYGTIEALNKAWNSVFWGQRYDDWSQIAPPTVWNEAYDGMSDFGGAEVHSQPAHAIEYLRFFSDSIRACYDVEAAAIRRHIPGALVTNNFQFRTLDFKRVCATCDVVAFDSYPAKNEPPHVTAFNYSICRCLQGPSKPFLLMEMTPNQSSWQLTVPLKRPGEVERIALKGIAYGADSAMFFQIRRSYGGFEQYHGAMIDHVGHEHTRIGDELRHLGIGLQTLAAQLPESTTRPQVAVVMDFDNKFGVETACGPQKGISYMDEVMYYYRYFHTRNIPVDVVQADADLSQYKLVVAPMLYMVNAKTADAVRIFVQKGGTFITTYYSGIVDEDNNVLLGGCPGAFREILGIWVEETDALKATERNRAALNERFGYVKAGCGFLCDIIRPEGATVLGQYLDDFYARTPCVTENRFGSGCAVFLGTKLDEAGLAAVLNRYTEDLGIAPVLQTPDGVEAVLRGKDGGQLLFLINSSLADQTVSLCGFAAYTLLYGGVRENSRITLAPNEVVVLAERSDG